MASHRPQDPPPGAPETPSGELLPLLNHNLGRLRPRAMTIRQLVTQRVEWRPARTCEGCRHLGPLVSVSDGHGARRLRRRCPHARGGCSAADWPACDRYEKEG
jgi:hypothetical protein